MLNFKKLELKDIEPVRAYLPKANSRLCDSTAGGIFMWREYFYTEYAIKDDALFFKVMYLDGKTAFSIPIGDHVPHGIEELKRYCRKNLLPLIFCTVSSANLALLKKSCEVISVKKERDWYDYLYASEDIIHFSGRKYSGQRNHINKFKKAYPDYRFEEINRDNIEKVKTFLAVFFKDHDTLNATWLEEKKKVYELFDHYFLYHLSGGMIIVDEQAVAISVGEIINDTLFIHVEKADKNYAGSYQMIVNEFAKYFAADLSYINREEDVGDEGLRISKMSYHPIELLEKSTVEVKV